MAAASAGCAPVLREAGVTLRPGRLVDFDDPAWPMSSVPRRP
ncbi:hypothetical protein [Streptomyces sp. NPDC001480]